MIALVLKLRTRFLNLPLVACNPTNPPSTLSELLVLLERNRPKELPMLINCRESCQLQRVRTNEISLDRVFETHRLFRRSGDSEI